MKAKLALVFSISIFVSAAGSGISLALPNQYTAKGLLIVTRKIDDKSNEFFTYEGSYAQQTAGSHLTTFLSILESPSNLKSTDSSMDIKKVSRLVKAKKEGAGSISLKVKGRTSNQAADFWNKIVDSAINTHSQIEQNGDPLTKIQKTPESPVIVRTYPDWETVFIACFAFSALTLFWMMIAANYLKEGNDR